MNAQKSIENVALDSKTTKNPLSTLDSSKARYEIFVNIFVNMWILRSLRIFFQVGGLSSRNLENPLSEREDLNLRPLDPQSSALPDCATSRIII